MKTTLKQQLQIGFLLLLQMIFLIYVLTVMEREVFYVIVAFFFLNVVILIWILIATKAFTPKSALSTLENNDLKILLEFGDFSLLQFDENLNIINTSGILKQKHPELISKKLTALHPGFADYILSRSGQFAITIDTSYYVVEMLSKDRVLVFKSVDDLIHLQEYIRENRLMVGMVHLDNLLDEFSYLEERQLTEISATLRKMVNDWAFSHNIMLRRVRDDRYFLVGKSSSLDLIRSTTESFLKEFKHASIALDSAITASIVLVYGSDEVSVLDTKTNELLELVQARGGDQLIIQDLNGSLEYYGGNSESLATKSNVRNRMLAQSVVDLIEEHQRIFVFGHKTMDFDSMGSCLAISTLAKAYNKDVYIVSESGGIEEKLSRVLLEYNSQLVSHQFISDEQALTLYQHNDLVIMVDHHNPEHSAASELITIAKKVIVIDHHRRGNNFVKSPLLSYIDSSASSVCEMMIEVFNASQHHIDLKEAEATIMYTGIVVDTNHFSARTGRRTFEACAYLKDFSIDLTRVNESLNEDIDDFNLKTKIGSTAYKYDSMMIAPFDENTIVSRSILSQVADHLLTINGIDASFVIGYINLGEVAISARSNKNVNVQVIMEKMNGGGHFNAAAMQRDDTTVKEVETQLLKIIDERKEGQ